jgi:hypothetical protein
MSAREEWEKYRIKGEPAKAGVELNIVRHIAHVPTARRIIEDQKIKAGLVYDQSRLNKSRISVVWLSANTWGFGSIYGTVEFQFDWNTLIDGNKVYWVEAMTQYNPSAYRFLISSRDSAEFGSALIAPYDPTKDDGPLRKSGDKWYWNANFTSEFMIDDDLYLREATGLDFVSHHQQFCSIDGNACVERRDNPTWDKTGGRILAHILAREIRVLNTHLKPEGGKRNQLLDTAYSGLHGALSDAKFGGALHIPASCDTIVTGALALYGMDQLASTLELLALLKSADGFNKALVAIVERHFGVQNWVAPS